MIYLSSFGLLVGCSGPTCVAVHYTTGSSIAWTIANAPLHIAHCLAGSVQGGATLLLAGFHADHTLTFVSGTTSSTAPTPGLTQTVQDDLVSVDSSADGKFAGVSTIKGILVFVRQDSTCDSSCNTCSAPSSPASCLTCYSGYTVNSGACIQIVCDPTCLTCSGNLATQCLTCRTTVRTYDSPSGKCNLIPPPPPQSLENTCVSGNLVFDATTNTCLDCFTYESFALLYAQCTKGNTVRYINWTAELGDR